MLGVKSPSQVAGDGITGVFRASGPLPRRTVRPGHAVEAYSWGALTSAVRGALGWVQRVLWLILLPFALINLAYWARLHVGQVGDDEHDRHVDDDITIVRSIWGAIIVRWAALVLTMLLVLAPSFIALDLVAWQCYRGATKSCDVLPGFLDFMMGLAPSQRMAVGTALPLAVTGLLWFLSRQTLARYEACKDTGTMAGGRHLLQDERFWSSTNRSRRLQRIHLAGAVATVMAYVAAQVGDLGAGWFAWFLTLVAGAVLVLCFAALTRAHPNDLEYRGKPTFTAGFPDRDAPVLLGLACAGMAILLAWLQWGLRDSSTGWDASQSWFGHNLWFIGTFVVLSALNTLVFVAGRLSLVWSGVALAVFLLAAGVATVFSLMGESPSAERVQWILAGTVSVGFVFFVVALGWQLGERRNHPAEAWNGGGAAMMIGAAGWIALLFTTALVTASADYLNGPEQSVSDLTSQGGEVEAAAADRLVKDEEATVAVRLSKGVVLRDGVVLQVGDGGRESYWLLRGDVQARTAEVAEPGVLSKPLPDTVLRRGTLALAEDVLRLVDTCVLRNWDRKAGEAPTSCHAESEGFRTAATIAVPARRLTVDTAGRVRLEVAEPPGTPLVLPQVLIWAPIIQVLWTVCAIVIAILCAARLTRRTTDQVGACVTRDGVPQESRNQVRRTRLGAAYAHRAERLLEMLGGVTVACVLALLCLSATGLPPNALVSTLFPGSRSDLPHVLASLSLYVVLGLSAAFVLLGSYVRRSESARKAVGILWDVTTFWPRAAHPLSPPCYAERVVPEMTTRVRWGLQQGDLVVVSGHSQGSLIAAATLIRLDDEELERIRFVTYGSQLRALYGRIFPCVLGPGVLGCVPTDGTPTFSDTYPDVPRSDAPAEVEPPGTGTLWDRLGRDGWRNFYRRGDPLGWRVFSDDESAYDVRVPEVPRPEAGDPGPKVGTHSGYQHSLEYRRVVGDWLGERLVEDEHWTIGEVQPLPEP
jgi:hypothetical protein